ncbi:MAG: LysM peptidoglycan-binding domain-containing protein [Myxococcota bacterium]
MTRRLVFRGQTTLLGAALLALVPVGAMAQVAPAEPPAGATPSNPTPTGVDVVSPGGTTTTTQSSIFGPAPASVGDVNSYLPSSAQASTDTSRSADGFDLNRAGAGEGRVVRGRANGAYIVSGSYVPDLHVAKRGDTLWSISRKYYGNSYNWPAVWAMNRQIQNPHWIYPGDQIRLKGGFGVRTVGGFVRPQAIVPPSTTFYRHYGYVLDGKHEVYGEVTGSPEDQMLLSENDEIYVKLDLGKKGVSELGPGDLLTLFEPRKLKNLTPYPVVHVRGIAKINRINKRTGMVRARIVESLTVIERGTLAGPMGRKIDVVEPVRNKQTVEARIVGALYPYEFYAQGHYVFIDKGKNDGLEVGNRFFAVSRGDEWRLGLKNAGNLADKRILHEDDRNIRTVDDPDNGQPELYPAETYAELLVLRVRERTATCLITASIREISRGSIIVARKDY